MTQIVRQSSRVTNRVIVTVVALATVLSAAGCDLRQRMYDQEKYEPHEATTFFFSSTHTSDAPAQSSGFVHLNSHTPSSEHVASFLQSSSFVHL